MLAVGAFARQQIRRHSRRLLTTTPSNTEAPTPVVIVGAGPSGLLLSRLLDSYGMASTVLEASPSLTTHPQAHFLNTRTMEILRHSLPRVYQKVREEMPPVEEWKSFRFGHDMNNIMAEVIHPVDIPLQANIDANGKLVPRSAEAMACEATEPLSVCSVGHLAQHTFCRLLNDAEAPLATVHYGMPVVDVEYGSDGLHRVHTQCGKTFVAPMVVAADGFHSTLRKLWKIPMDGQEGIQHLMNVHIRVDASSIKVPPAMLYSIWNSHLVGMMVRHSPQEYILQIPYFPPYQTMERNFTPEKVQTMVEAAFDTCEGIFIESIRPWTMSSLIARNYVANATGGVLVGDAAHAFPPAGGFGMNTGLQDVHNLAWRLPLWHKKGQSSQRLSFLLSRYEAERRPVAQRNAALSVRNYRRILELSKACYLNDQHPTLLLKLLDQMTLLPLGARQTMFQSLLETAMLPLRTLKNPSNPHARLITGNIRTILEQGGGLPLLFPKFELGFGYGDQESVNAEDWTQDSMGYTPQLKVGYLLSHVELEVVNYSEDKYPNLQAMQDTDTTRVRITSSDLPLQLRLGDPCFVVLLVNGSDVTSEIVLNALDVVRSKSGVHIASVQVVAPNEFPEDNTLRFDLVVRDDDSKLSTLTKTEDSVLILIRPDGHLGSIVSIQEKLELGVEGVVLEAMEQALGTLD